VYAPGDIVLVDLSPTVGHEQGANPSKSPFRPCLVVGTSAGRCLDYYTMFTIVPFTTSRSKTCGECTPTIPTPSRSTPDGESVVLVPQIRSIAKERISKKVNTVQPSDMATVNNAIKSYLNL